MKKLYTIIIGTAAFFGVQKASAQNGDFGDLIKSSPADATKLVDAYSTSLFRGFGTGLNSGWNNTARTKKLLHFDLRITASGAFVPESDKSFNVTQIGLSNHVRPNDASKVISPTFGGASVNGPVMDVYNDAGAKTGSFTMPKGVSSVIPAPAVQLTVGLPANFDVTIRTIPTISVSDDIGKVGMIGFGVKHNFTGGGLKSTLPFDLALAVNYNSLNYTRNLNVRPSSGAVAGPGASQDFSNQKVDASVSGIMAQAIISKKLLFFTPFLSVGYQSASTKLNILGNYPVESSTTVGGATVTGYTTFSDPVTINETSVSGVRADVGFQMDLSIFKIYASGAVGKYPSVNGGIGFGF